MSKQFADDLFLFSNNISQFLRDHILSHNGFSSRTFYAEAFSLILLKVTGKLSVDVENILWREINAKERSSPHFHGEFIQYALGDKWMDFPLKNNGVTNWILLKCLVNLRHNQQRNKSLADAKKIISHRQRKNGLIEDNSNVRSFQYHCFSLALIHELWALTNDSFFQIAFRKGMTFIKEFISMDGSSLYIGRGQEQLFGYASLVYILSVEHELDLLKKVINYLQLFSRDNGEFPLVLRKGEVLLPYQPDLRSEGYLGWYGYNNYFDYLAFAGLFFQKSYEVLSNTMAVKKSDAIPTADYFDGMFRKVKKQDYEAFISVPSGVYANDMAFPYIVSKSHGRLTPCYGGEECLPSLFNNNDIPLPYFIDFNRTIRNKSCSWFSPNALHILSPMGYVRRNFQFHAKTIKLETGIRSPFKSRHQYLFFDDVNRISEFELSGRGFRIVSEQPIKFNRFAYCALGRLKVFDVEPKKSTLTFEILN